MEDILFLKSTIKMDLIVYRNINEFYDFFENIVENVDSLCYTSILENIDSIRNGFKDLLHSAKYRKLLKNVLKCETKKEIIFQGDMYYLIVGITYLYNMHPIIKYLIIFFYLSKEYKKCDVKLHFELSLREYMGFDLKHESFEMDCNCLTTFILQSLTILHDSVNITVNYLINMFNKHHFPQKFLEKEYSETLSVFNIINNDNKRILNICSGNACGIHFLNFKMTCLDLNRYMGINLLNKMNICDFIECNIHDEIFESISSTFNVWIGIHACRNLSVRILETFIKYAPDFSILYLVPCCVFSKRMYKLLLSNSLYKRIFKTYYVPIKKHKLREHCYPAMHMEYLSILCINYKFKIKTLRNMKSEKNKVLIVYK